MYPCSIPKLAPKFYGPFKVVDTVGKVAYKLELPVDAQIHNVFHVSQLRKAFGHIGQVIPLPDTLTHGIEFEPLAILERRMVKRGSQAAAQLLIHWRNLSSAKATWEFALEIRRQFPTFSHEDKGSQMGTLVMKIGAELEVVDELAGS